uniref:Pathogenesis-related protein PR-4B n=1 Tax=Aegilops tauschii TaxID=37682 RepID=R7WFN0_AEGTA
MAMEVAVGGTRMPVLVLVLMALVMVCLSANGAAAQRASGVAATYNLYNPEKINWDLRVASVYCATWDAVRAGGRQQAAGVAAEVRLDGVLRPCRGARPVVLRSLPQGDEQGDGRADGGEGGGPVRQRRARLDLAAAVFRRIDTDGGGVANGHLIVDYEFVGCQD